MMGFHPGGPAVHWEPIFDRSFSNDVNADAAWSGDFDAVMVQFSVFKPVTDDVELDIYLSGDGGATFDAAANDYRTASNFLSTVQTGFAGLSDRFTPSQSGAGNAHGNAANEFSNGRIIVASPFDASTRTALIGRGGYDAAGSFGQISWRLYGRRNLAKRTDAIRLTYRSGNIDQGRLIGWGVRYR